MLNVSSLKGTASPIQRLAEGSRIAMLSLGDALAASRDPYESAARNSDAILRVANVAHRYGDVVALDHVSLEVQRGEFLTILGESGSGKTTMLRVISGLERATSIDELVLEGVDVRAVPAAQRNCTTVFQSYALFPHMSVEENVAYGLKLRNVPKDERESRTREALAMVRLSLKGQRRIGQLSGGERQRVALARALVTGPAILLLDEPLGALDEKLRYDMQAELVEIHRKLGMTFIYITHSQEEALTMSDRIVLMRRGRIEQRGTPEALFDRPVSRFAAEFMGFDNVIPCRLVERHGNEFATVRIGNTVVQGVCAEGLELQAGGEALLAVRAERLVPGATHVSDGRNLLPCRPNERTYRGKYTDQSALMSDGVALKIRLWDQSAAAVSFEAVSCRISDCVLLPA